MKLTHYHFKKLDSTNNWAKKNAESFNTNEITLITANEQTAGRGRFSRKWISPPEENIYASFFFLVSDSRKDFGNLSQILAISIVDVLQRLGFCAQIKWPNDIFCNQKKIGGILCETIPLKHKRAVINGFGLNVNMETKSLKKIEGQATSLLQQRGNRLDVNALTLEISKSFIQNLTVFLEKGFLPFLSAFRNLCFLPKTSVQFTYEGKKGIGRCQKINDDGTITIQMGNKRVDYYLGEIL